MITINKENINNFIKHGYEIIIDIKQQNWDIYDINAFKDQIINDYEIFYDETNIENRQFLINCWIVDLLNHNNNNNEIQNLAIEFKNQNRSETFYFYLNKTVINDNNHIFKITLLYEY